MHIEEDSILEAVRPAGPRIKHFHLNEINRGFHGSGHGDYRGVIMWWCLGSQGAAGAAILRRSGTR